MGKLFAVVVTLIALASAAIFALHIWWVPPDISSHGSRIDRQLNETMIVAGVLFVGAQLALACFVWRFSASGTARPSKSFPGGPTPMVVLATVLVGAEILVLTFVGSKVWADVYQTPPAPGALQIEVQAEQFAFYFRYAGTDGKFGAMHPELMNDATENFFGLDPANDTTARDDIVVGGLVIPLHFTATTPGKYELVCTQLCGLGHYNMRAFVEVKPRAAFDQWLKEKAAAL